MREKKVAHVQFDEKKKMKKPIEYLSDWKQFSDFIMHKNQDKITRLKHELNFYK